MEPIHFEKIDNTFHIIGYPDAIKIIKISNHYSRQISDLALHKNDLITCRDCLIKINEIPENDIFLREVLWNQSIIIFLKCFGVNKSRNHLIFEKVFKNDTGATIPFEYFKNLRNRNIVHDENSYSQSLTGAILNKEDVKPKIAKIINTVINSVTLEISNYSNLELLINKSINWVENKLNILCDKLMIELENIDFKLLVSYQNLEFIASKLSEIAEKRIDI